MSRKQHSNGRWTQKFRGKSAIVTGGASGIGAALGSALASYGAHVVLADLDGEGAQRSAGAVQQAVGDVGSARGVQVDVTDRSAVRQLVLETAEQEDGLDFLFNNAGITGGGPTEHFPPEHWDRTIDVNLGGVVNGVIAALPVMVARGRGHIVNTASAAGLVPAAFAVAYCTTKHAVVGLSSALRPEVAAQGVRVSVLCPGMVETPILDKGPPADLPRSEHPGLTGRAYLTTLGMRPMSAERLAHVALRGVARNRAIIVTPATPRIGWWLQRVSPGAVDAVNRRGASRVRAAMAALPDAGGQS